MSIDREGRGGGPVTLAGPPETIGREALAGYFVRAAVVLRRHRRTLDRLDAALGDGDHGENMAVGFDAVGATLGRAPVREDLGSLLRAVGHALVADVGGASGPLYGSALIEAAFVVGDRQTLDIETIADALEAAERGLARRGRCAIGDKTILDALAPAAAAFRAAAQVGVPLEPALREAARAAYGGMRATTPLVARRGLALRLGERSRGHQDPGATSCFLLMRAMVGTRAGGNVP